jgi:hypothetical protein
VVARTPRVACRRKLAVLPSTSRSCAGESTPALRRRHGMLLLCANGVRCVDETRSRCGDAHAARRDSWKDALLTDISRLARPPPCLAILGTLVSQRAARPNDADDEEPALGEQRPHRSRDSFSAASGCSCATLSGSRSPQHHRRREFLLCVTVYLY